jgi:hypothetical protein
MFKRILDDISKNLEGKPFEIRVGVANGQEFEGTWQWLDRQTSSDAIVVMDVEDDVLPVYIHVNAIIWVLPVIPPASNKELDSLAGTL